MQTNEKQGKLNLKAAPFPEGGGRLNGFSAVLQDGLQINQLKSKEPSLVKLLFSYFCGMRSAACILSLYVFAVATAPVLGLIPAFWPEPICCLDACSDARDAHQDQNGQEKGCSEFCNPFLSCGCYLGCTTARIDYIAPFVPIVDGGQYNRLEPIHAGQVVFPIWNPPKA